MMPNNWQGNKFLIFPRYFLHKHASLQWKTTELVQIETAQSKSHGRSNANVIDEDYELSLNRRGSESQKRKRKWEIEFYDICVYVNTWEVVYSWTTHSFNFSQTNEKGLCELARKILAYL